MLSSVTKSTRRDKKYLAEFTDGTRVHFGGSGYGDYTTFPADICDEKRRLYRLRHKGDRLTSPRTAGALSYFLLWGDSPNLSENISAFKKRFKV
jgi:hypothetical protein